MIIEPNEIPVIKLQSLLAGSIAPRPIALVSTIDSDGKVNLSPFSFFNSFSINPPVLVFSPSRRVRNNSTKHTYENIKSVAEACINVVNYNIVEQVSLSSTEYEKGVNEFVKAGLTEVKSMKIAPPGVLESPVRFECNVLNIIPLGNEAGAGNLVICQIMLIHLQNEILNENGLIDPDKIDLVGRLGEDYYCRTSNNSKFVVKKPLATCGIGVDSLPERIKNSSILTGNDLGKLGNLEKLPSKNEIESFIDSPQYKELIINSLNNESLHLKAQELIIKGQTKKALLLLMSI